MSDTNYLNGPPELTGFIDHVDWHGFSGWACDADGSGESIWLEIIVDDGAPVAFLANMLRPDLEKAGFGEGRHGFDLRFPMPLDPMVAHSIIIRRRDDQTWLPHSPVQLAAAPRSSADSKAAFEAAVRAEVASTRYGSELDTMLRFLLQQADRLLQGRTDAVNGSTALQQFRLRWHDYLEGKFPEPLKPDARPWALVVDIDLPETAEALAVLDALKELGLRVAVASFREPGYQGAVSQALTAAGVLVLGGPEYFTVEDALRRNRGLFRAILLRGGVAAGAYGLVARLHQPRARIIAMLGDPARDRTDMLANLAGAILADAVTVETPALLQTLKTQLPARAVALLDADAEATEIAQTLAGLGVVSVAVTPPGSRGPA
jgi:hypothetical protein